MSSSALASATIPAVTTRRSALPLITSSTSGEARQMSRQMAQSQTHMPQQRRPVSCATPISGDASLSVSMDPPFSDGENTVAGGTDKKGPKTAQAQIHMRPGLQELADSPRGEGVVNGS